MLAKEDFFVYLHSIMKKKLKIVNQELYPLGISHSEMRILMLVYHSDGCSQEEISSKMEVDRSNVGRALKNLEKLNYIKKEKDKEDGRAYKVFLTEKGWAIRNQLLEIKSSLQKTFTRGITAQDLNKLVKILKKIDQSLCEENYPVIKNSDKNAL